MSVQLSPWDSTRWLWTTWEVQRGRPIDHRQGAARMSCRSRSVPERSGVTESWSGRDLWPLFEVTSNKFISYSTLALLSNPSSQRPLNLNEITRSYRNATGSLYTDQGGISSLRHSIRLVSPFPLYNQCLRLLRIIAIITIWKIDRADDKCPQIKSIDIGLYQEQARSTSEMPAFDHFFYGL